MATQIVEISGDEAALLRSYQKAIDKQLEYERRLRDGGQAGAAAGTQIEDALNKVQQANDKALKGYLSDLRSISPEGAAAADALKGHLVDAGKAGFNSLDTILDRIREIDPEAADAAAAARQSLVDAANSSENQFRKVLSELQGMGPEGRQAAEQIKQSLVSAGKLSEKSIEDVAKALHQIDPEAAKAADAIVANIKRGSETSKNIFSGFGTHAIAEITSIAGAYVGVQEAIQLVNDYLTEQREKVRELANAQIELASIQETASKNLAGVTRAERLGLLDQAPQIAIESGIDTKVITEALGAVASTGLTDPAQIKDIVRQGAKLNRLTPDELPEAAAGAADIMAKTGLTDIRQALTLFLTTGAQSLVADPAKLQAALPRALGAGIVSARQQDPEEAAREAAAIFAMATNVGTDPQGASSATFSIDFINRMNQFFTGIERERVEARSKIELIERKIDKGKDTELDRLKKTEAEQFLKESEGVFDPGTIFGRLEMLQKSNAMANQFKGEKGFGEKQFQPYLNEVLDGNTVTAQKLKESKEGIKADVPTFENQSEELASSTAAISMAVAKSELKAVREAGELMKKDKSATGVIREEVAATMKTTQLGGLDGWSDWALDDTYRMGSHASDAAFEAIQRLLMRKMRIADGGIQGQEEQANIEIINATIEKVFGIVARDIQAGILDPKLAAETRWQASRAAAENQMAGANPEYVRAYERLAKLLERVAASTDATAKSNQAMVAPSQETAQNTSKQPLATPGLGSASNGP